jgi:hypothetical protein
MEYEKQGKQLKHRNSEPNSERERRRVQAGHNNNNE